MTFIDAAADQYHSDQIDDHITASKTVLHRLLTHSPAHAAAIHPRLTPNQPVEHDPKFDIGTVCHQVLLEGDANVVIVDAPDWRTKDAKQQRDEARAHLKTPLLAHQWSQVEEMAGAVREQFAALELNPLLFEDGKAEQTIVWQERGVWCRARLDWIRDDLQACDDLKTTSGAANPEQWVRTMYGIGGDLQARLYQRGLRAVTGKDVPFRFVVAETQPPYGVAVVSLSPAAEALADAKLDYALDVWKRCLETGVWPGYQRKVHFAEPPSYLEYDWLNRMEREGVAA